MSTVTKQSILSFLLEHKHLLQTKYKVVKIGLFGSCVKNQETQESDIDILVDMPSNYDLKEFLESTFNKSIDLGLEKNIRSLIKEKIDKEIIYV